MATTAVTMQRSGSTSGSLKRFLLLLNSNLLMFLRNRAATFWIIVFPIGLMLVLGAMYGNEKFDPTDPNSLTAISFITPGLIVLSLMSNGLVGNATSMAQLREKGILRRIQTTPLPVSHLILSRVLMQTIIMVGQAAIMTATSILVFTARYDVAGLIEAIPWIILGAILFMAIGQAVAALVRKVETVSVVSQVVNFPLMFLGTLWIPASSMPDWLQAVSKFLPSTMVADLVRTPMLAAIQYEPSIPLLFAFLGIIAYLVAAIALSTRYFKWN